MLRLRDGSWLAAYMYSGPKNRIRIKRSFDNMQTWQFVTEIVDPTKDFDNPMFCPMANGDILVAVRSFLLGRTYFIETFVSKDQGNSFQHQSIVDGGYVQGVYEPYLYVLPNGSLACFYANESHVTTNPSYAQTLSERISVDGGYTWGPETYAIAQPGYSRPGTCNIIALPGGELAMFYELCGTDNCYGHVTYSTDGIHWSGLGPRVPQTFQAIQSLLMSNGLILISSNSRDMVISPDYTNSWMDPQIYSGSYGQWPGLYEIGPNQFVVVTTGAGPNGEAGVYLKFATIDPSQFEYPPISACRSGIAGLIAGRHPRCR